MKISITTLLFMMVSLSSLAGVSEQHMQEMMQQAEAAQKCFATVDQSKFEQMQMEMQQIQAELKSMCDAGKRSEAMSAAMKQSKKYSNDAEIKKMKKCADMMKGMMANMPALPGIDLPTGADKDKHICDAL